MAFDPGLAERVRAEVAQVDGCEERRMFGGLAWLVHGNMAVGVLGDDLIVRVGAEAYESAMSESGTRPFGVTGRPMRGWVVVSAEATGDYTVLAQWVRRGAGFASSLAPKQG